MTWSIVPVTVAQDARNPALINITFRATNSNGTVVEDVAGRVDWSVEKEISFRQDFLTRLISQDAQNAKTLAFLPQVQSYVSSNPAPIVG